MVNVKERPFSPQVSVVIVNPYSGRPYLEARRSLLLKELRLQGYTVWETEQPGHAEDLARRAEAQGREAIIVVGGDGTLLETAQGITHRVRLAHFPAGTINLLALALGVPSHPRAFLRLLYQGNLKRIYCADTGKRRFFSVASVGFDAVVVEALAKKGKWKRHLQEGAFALVSLREYLRYDPPEMEVYLDGVRFPEPVLGVLVGRVPYFAGARVIFPTITPKDQELEVLLLRGSNKHMLWRYTFGLLTGRLAGMEGVHVQRVREVEVMAHPPAAVEVDGEPSGTTPVRFTVPSETYSFLAPLQG